MTTKVGAAAATTAGLTYDGAGNTLTTPLSGAAATLTWDTAGRLATLTTAAGAAGNVYDAGGSLLVKKTVAGAKTLFLGETEVTHTPAKGVVPASTTSRRTYTFAGQAVATRTAAGDTGLWFTPPNPQGTAATQINASTAAITKRYFTPFGGPRGAAPAWQSPHGFRGGTGATTDSTTGLTHLGAPGLRPGPGPVPVRGPPHGHRRHPTDERVQLRQQHPHHRLRPHRSETSLRGRGSLHIHPERQRPGQYQAPQARDALLHGNSGPGISEELPAEPHPW